MAPCLAGKPLFSLPAFLLTWLSCMVGHGKAGIVLEYCMYDKFQARCSQSEVVKMDLALFGHMALGRCVRRDVGHLGCSADVTSDLDLRCSGRRLCNPSVMSMFATSSVCEGLERYIEVSYSCLGVVSTTKEQCLSSDSMFAPPPPGYLANIVTAETECGSTSHPWVIEVANTQKVNLTLMDFGVENNKELSTASPGSNCRQYAIIREEKRAPERVCGGQMRERHAYLSKTHRVMVILATPPDISDNHFLLKYEVVGCPEPVYPDQIMWLKVHHDHVIIHCLNSNAKWKLECKDGRWHGNIGNCSQGPGDVLMPQSAESVAWTMFQTSANGLTAYVMVGVSVLITIIVLIIVLIYKDRQARLALQMPQYGHHGDHQKDGSCDLSEVPPLPTKKKQKSPPNSTMNTGTGTALQTLNRFNTGRTWETDTTCSESSSMVDYTMPLRNSRGHNRGPSNGGTMGRFSELGQVDSDPDPPPYPVYRPVVKPKRPNQEHIYDKPNWDRMSGTSFSGDVSPLYKSLDKRSVQKDLPPPSPLPPNMILPANSIPTDDEV